MANDQVTRQEFGELRDIVKNGFAAVDKRFTDMDAKFDSRFAEMEARLQSQLADLEVKLIEKMRDMQTELLRAFMPWQQGIHTHIRELEANTNNSVQSIRTRMDALEDRMLQLERRLLGPY